MAPHPGSDADYIRDKARRDLLTLLEGVSKAAAPPLRTFRVIFELTGRAGSR